MKEAIKIISVVVLAVFFSACSSETTKEKIEEGSINPLNPESMVNTYEDSKGKINDAVEKESEKLNKMMEDSGIHLE